MKSEFLSRPGYTFRAIALAALLASPLTSGAAQTDTEIVTNETIIHMVTGKLGKDLVIGKINAAVPGFDLSSEGLVQLTTAKVDQGIVKAMFDAAESAKRRNTSTQITGTDEVLNNDVVIRMVSSKVGKDLIMRKLSISRSQFDVSSAGLVNLQSSKVPQDIIKVMMLPPKAPEAAPTTIPVRAPISQPTEKEKAGTKAATKPGDKTTTKPADKSTAKPAAKTPPPPAKKPPTSH